MTSKLQQSVQEAGTTPAEYLRMALALQGICASEQVCDRIITTYDKLDELGGDFSVHDAVKIQVDMDKKYAEKIVVSA